MHELAKNLQTVQLPSLARHTERAVGQTVGFKPDPASSVNIRRLWDTRNLRRTSPSSKHYKKYRATRPTAGDKLEACLYNSLKFVGFYQWSHTVSIEQRRPLQSICQKLNSPIFPRKKNLRRIHESSNPHILLLVITSRNVHGGRRNTQLIFSPWMPFTILNW